MKTNLKIVIISVLITILLTSAFWLVFGATPTGTHYISAGIYPGAPTYTIWGEGANYFAKNAHGYIAYDSTNSSEVIQNCVGVGNTLLLIGDITLQTQIVLTSNMSIVGQRYGTEIFLATDIYGFNITNINNVLIRDLTFTVSVASYSSAVIFIGGNSRDIWLEDLYLWGRSDYSGKGIHLQTNANGIYRTTLTRITTYYFSEAIHLEPTGTNGFVTSCSFTNLNIWYPLIGVQFSTSDATQDLSYNVFVSIFMQCNANFQRGINMNETTGDVWHNRFYGITVFDAPASASGFWIDEPLNDFFGIDSIVRVNGTQKYGSLYFASQHFKLRYWNPEPNPVTWGWGVTDAGLMWYCGAHQQLEYWNGTHIVGLP